MLRRASALVLIVGLSFGADLKVGPYSNFDYNHTVAAQTPGKASFVVYEKGVQVGTLDTSVTRTDDGWRLQGSMRTGGTIPVTIVNLDLLYDRDWFGRWMTMEMKQPDDVIVHVAVGRTTAQTDVVRPTEARFQSNSVSPNTILLPNVPTVRMRRSRRACPPRRLLLTCPCSSRRLAKREPLSKRRPRRRSGPGADRLPQGTSF
jgi:hypothetical protein